MARSAHSVFSVLNSIPVQFWPPGLQIVRHVKAAVLEIKIAVGIGYVAQYTAGIASRQGIVRNVPGDHASRTDDHIIANFHPRINHHIAAKPDIVANGHFCPIFIA